MKKVIALISMLIVLISSLTSCYMTGVYKLSIPERKYMQMCAFFSVPIDMYNDTKYVDDLNCTAKERDSQGRLLFTLIAYNFASEQHEEYMVILQKHDFNYIYYYEDQSYLMPGYSDSDIELLKTANDWDKELDETKMSGRRISLTLDGVINYYPHIHGKSFLKKLEEDFNISEDSIVYYVTVDHDNKENCMYNIKTDVDGEIKIYYVMCNKDFELSIWEPENGEFTPSEYAKFKRENGWVYGFN